MAHTPLAAFVLHHARIGIGALFRQAANGAINFFYTKMVFL
jgi:hypothetical protein